VLKVAAVVAASLGAPVGLGLWSQASPPRETERTARPERASTPAPAPTLVARRAAPPAVPEPGGAPAEPAAPLPAPAEGWRIEGRVVDDGGRPVPGARLEQAAGYG
jgi:hypothetical protein